MLLQLYVSVDPGLNDSGTKKHCVLLLVLCSYTQCLTFFARSARSVLQSFYTDELHIMFIKRNLRVFMVILALQKKVYYKLNRRPLGKCSQRPP